jgi:hypothetical protein
MLDFGHVDAASSRSTQQLSERATSERTTAGSAHARTPLRRVHVMSSADAKPLQYMRWSSNVEVPFLQALADQKDILSSVG